ncbi:unnamed protein product, partial [Prorocentrum cordatum]
MSSRKSTAGGGEPDSVRPAKKGRGRGVAAAVERPITCMANNGSCGKATAGNTELCHNHLNVHALGFGWMALAEFKEAIKSDPEFNKQVEAALRVKLGLEENNFFQEEVSLDVVSGVRVINRVRGLTVKRFKEVFNKTPQQCGKVIRDLDDGKGGKYKGVVVEDEAGADVIYELFTTTYKHWQQYKQMANNQLHASQAQTIFAKVKLDEFMDVTPYNNASSVSEIQEKAKLKAPEDESQDEAAEVGDGEKSLDGCQRTAVPLLATASSAAPKRAAKTAKGGGRGKRPASTVREAVTAFTPPRQDAASHAGSVVDPSPSPVQSEAMLLVNAKMAKTSISECLQISTGRSMGGADVLKQKLKAMGATVELKIWTDHEDQYQELDSCIKKLRDVELPEQLQRSILERSVTDILAHPDVNIEQFFNMMNPLSGTDIETTFNPEVPSLSGIAMSQEDKAKMFADKLVLRYLLQLIEAGEEKKDVAQRFALFAIKWLDGKIDDSEITISPEVDEVFSTCLTIMKAMCCIIDHIQVVGKTYVSRLVENAKKKGGEHSMSGLVYNALQSNVWYQSQYKKFVDNMDGLEKWGDAIHLRTKEIVKGEANTTSDPYEVLKELEDMKNDLDTSVWLPYASSIEDWLVAAFNFGDMHKLISKAGEAPAKQKAMADAILRAVLTMKACFPGREAELKTHEQTAIEVGAVFEHEMLLQQAMQTLSEFKTLDLSKPLLNDYWEKVAQLVSLAPEDYVK